MIFGFILESLSWFGVKSSGKLLRQHCHCSGRGTRSLLLRPQPCTRAETWTYIPPDLPLHTYLPPPDVLMLIKTMSCSVSWCRWVTMQRKSMTSESWLRGDITPTGHHSMVTPVPVSRGVSVNSAHLATFWKLLKSSQRSWQNWPKSVKKKV